MNSSNELPDQPLDLDAELEIIQTRQLLGMPSPNSDLTERLLARTINRIEAGEPAPLRRASSTATRRSRLTYWAVAAGIVLLAVTGVTLWPSSPAMASPPGLDYMRDISNPRTSPAASGVISQLAESSSSYVERGQGSVQYVATTGWITATDANSRTSSIVPKERRWWVVPDGSALANERTSPALNPDGTVQVAGSTGEVLSSDEFPSGTIPSTPGGFSVEPDALRQELTDVCRDSPDEGACLLTRVSELASTSLLSNDFTRALWEALEQVDSIYDLGVTTDRLGREVVALAAGPHPTSAGTSVVVLLVEVDTGRPVGTEEVTLTSETMPIKAPTVTALSVITSRGWVEEAGESTD